ncbi:MAG: hypothetical protein NUW37_03045 [Planctomycetes bacterium]|nr:hypothetical protein [Planctomycetota bacterium]
MPERRERWSSRRGFVLSSISGVLCLPSIFYFPKLAETSGGGAFLIPALFALVTCGIPALTLELGIGHFYQSTAPRAFRRINPRLEWLGWWSLASSGLLAAAMSVFLGASLIQILAIAEGFDSASLPWQGFATSDGWAKRAFLLGGGLTITSTLKAIAAIFAGFVLVYGLCIGRTKRIAQMALLSLLIIAGALATLLVIGVRQDGAGVGLIAVLSPDFRALSSGRPWINAFTIVFLTLGIGTGINHAFGSFLPKKTDVTTNSYIVSFSVAVVGFVMMLAVYLGFGRLALASHQPIEVVSTEGPSLIFFSMPLYLSALDEDANLVRISALLLFLMIFALALITISAIVFSIASALYDKYGLPLTKSTLIVCGICYAFGAAGFFSLQSQFFDVIFLWLSKVLFLIVILVQVLIAGWIADTSKLSAHLDEVSEISLGKLWRACVRWIIPFALILCIVSAIVNAPDGDNHPAYTHLVACAIILTTIVASVFFLTKKSEARDEPEI